MSNIQLKKDVLLSLSNVARDVYLAGEKPMIKNIKNKNVIAISVANAVNRVLADKGVNMEKDDIQYLKTSITKDIFSDFYTFSLEDISLAFSMGVRGKLGEYYGINVTSLYQWLVKYQQEIVPKANEEIYNAFPKPILEEPVDKKKLEIELANDIINLIGSNDCIYHNDFGNIKYNLLDKYKLLNFTISEKNKFYELAKVNYKNDLLNNNLELIRQGKISQISSMKNLLNSIENVNKTTNDILIIYAKKLAFKEFILKVSDKKKFEEQIMQKINENN